MKFKMTYLVYRLKVIWPLFDLLSELTFVVLTMCVVFFAVYFELALIWAIFLTIFLIQSIKMASEYSNLSAEQRKTFPDEYNAEAKTSQMRANSYMDKTFRATRQEEKYTYENDENSAPGMKELSTADFEAFKKHAGNI